MMRAEWRYINECSGLLQDNIMMGTRLLRYLEPLTQMFPSVYPPTGHVNKKERLVYTGITLFIYLVCCQMPLYGIHRVEGSDPFYWMRVILASNRGTLMELGLSPIVSAGWILQIMVGFKLLDLDLQDPHHKNFYDGAQKLLALCIATGQAVVYVWSGGYGPLNEVGAGNAVLIVLQLVGAGFLVILLDDMLEKGYGLSSGISLFIAVNICQTIIWRTMSPIMIKTESGIQFQGSLIALVHLVFTRRDKSGAIFHAFYRASSPNLAQLLSTLVVFLLVIYLQGFKINVKTTHRQFHSTRQYPVKLFYTSNISVILQSALVSNLYVVLRLLANRFRDSWWMWLLGVWQDRGGQTRPISGLAYWISPPQSFYVFLSEPIHAIVYLCFIMASCGFFARFWIEVSGQSAKHVANRLKKQGMKMDTHNTGLPQLTRLIPIAATLGGMIIGLISVLSDLMGCIGSGTSILLAVSIIYGYYKDLVSSSSTNQRELVY